MKQYKTLEYWNGYEKGALVPEDVALRFLAKYVRFEDQSILQVEDVVMETPVEKVIEVPKTTTPKKQNKKTNNK